MNHRLIKRALMAAAISTMWAIIGCTYTGIRPHKANVDPEISTTELIAHIQYLAADEREGRFPGSAGSRAAAEYITKQWAATDIIAPDALPGMRQTFTMTSGVSTDEGCVLSIGEEELVLGGDFIPLGFSSQGSFSGGAVYAGLGLSDDDSAAVAPDLTGQWLLVFRPAIAAGSSTHGSPIAALIHQALRAKDAGAVGLIAISSPEADTLVALRYDRTIRDAGLAAISVSAGVGDRLLAGLDMSSTEAWTALSTGATVTPTPVPQVEISAQVQLKHSTSRAGNVVGYLPGGDPDLQGQYIVIGAHFDHLGYGGPGSGSMVPREHAVHNGADDNASGVAAVIEVAEKFSAERQELRRSLLFVAFDGEEQGLLGSKYFVEHSPVPVDSIVLMINLDMIGQLRENRLMVGGTGTSPQLEQALQEFNRKYQLDLRLSAEGPGPSDHSSFYGEDIPVLFLFTGAHEDYHRPTDDWQGVDPAGVRIVAELAYDMARYFNQRDERPEFTSSGMAADMPSRRSFRVTFGIIPGYGSTEAGLAVDGVKEGGPAEKAGMLKDDVIIAVDGKEITNIRDYMFRLGELNPGDSVEVQVLRAGEVASLTLQL